MQNRTVLCFGDSNTHGTIAMETTTDRRRHAKADRWPSVMEAQLGAEWDVVAEGHPGRTSVFDDPIEGAHKNGLRALLTALESHRPIDLVILMLGTNDLKARFSLSANDIALGIQRLTVDILRSDTGPDGQAPRVLLAAPVIATETGIFVDIFAGAAEKSRALPDKLHNVAAQQHVGFIDLNAVAETDPVDGIHLDAAAQSAIGLAMARAVSDLMT
ncbi:SGNH/GDSL hydrolase family protein [Tateyamaria pelophila]|uniref:SGNH/GDSL hydrolase family protein n=1 Tax=Tateyamaria pelophila TaxID=328415 RepID=UPI001CBE6441|nr:SGNH/GDSL hydrolase family protein [Tateyamaria pelophila]